MPELTPFQTVGPFFALGLSPPGPARLAEAGALGEAIAVEGRVLDGAGAPVPDALVEVWQADARGRFAHADDERCAECDPHLCGFGRAPTDDAGRYRIETVRPGRVAGPGGALQAPHLLLNILARGMLTRLVTRVYFAGDAANDDDPILALVPPARRPTLVARRAGAGAYAHDIVLQGEGETVFFDV